MEEQTSILNAADERQDEEASDEETTQQQAKKKKQATDTRKQIWIITVLASMTDITVTREMLTENDIDIDEWFYALSENEMDQIIIIHTRRSVSAERITNVLNKVLRKKKSKSIRQMFTLSGFDMITSSGGRRDPKVANDLTSPLRIENHPGFQRIASIIDNIDAGNEEDETVCFNFRINKKDAGIFAFKKNLMIKSLPKKRKNMATEIENLNEANAGLRAALDRAISEKIKAVDETARLKRFMAQHGLALDLSADQI